jgi:osmoprotectant transport system ATP-binding protein
MSGGKIVQYATPEEILKNPLNDFVETFVGKDRLWRTPDMLRAVDVMSKKVIKIGPNRSIAHAIELMKQHDTNVLVVTESASGQKEKMLGIVGTNRLKGVLDNSIKMKDIMKTDVISIPADMTLVEVLNIRKEKQIMYSPVVDIQSTIVGVITNTSIINVLTDIVPEREEY